MSGDGDKPLDGARQRIDKWLFFARLRKSRTLAARSVEAGDVRVNDLPVRQPAHFVRPGDVVTLHLDRHDAIVRVLAPGERRGPFEEARRLYEDLTPPREERARLTPFEQAMREPGAGRPTKRERRATDRLRNGGNAAED